MIDHVNVNPSPHPLNRLPVIFRQIQDPPASILIILVSHLSNRSNNSREGVRPIFDRLVRLVSGERRDLDLTLLSLVDLFVRYVVLLRSDRNSNS